MPWTGPALPHATGKPGTRKVDFRKERADRSARARKTTFLKIICFCGTSFATYRRQVGRERERQRLCVEGLLLPSIKGLPVILLDAVGGSLTCVEHKHEHMYGRLTTQTTGRLSLF